MPKGKKHTPEQTVAILRRLETGEKAKAVCRSVNISEATLYLWKRQYGALELSEVKELKALREENARLRRVVADQLLNIQVLKEVNAKNGEPVAEATRSQRRGRGGLVFPASGVPPPWVGPLVGRQAHRRARRTVQRVRRQEGLRVTGPSRRPKCPPRPESKIRVEALHEV
jgi:putative transposase